MTARFRRGYEIEKGATRCDDIGKTKRKGIEVKGKKMRRIVVLLLGVLMLMASVPEVVAAPPSTPFSGAWIGHDPAPPDGDGSTVHLLVEGGKQVRVTFTDEFGSVCVNVGASDTAFSSLLTGAVSDTTLNAVFRIAKCGSTPLRFLIGEQFTFEYDDMGTASPADDTLWDGSVLWTRDN